MWQCDPAQVKCGICEQYQGQNSRETGEEGQEGEGDLQWPGGEDPLRGSQRQRASLGSPRGHCQP